MRMLTQQNIMETKNSMNTAISRREMDEIILKFNFEMLDEMFGKKLEDDIQKNVDLKSQLALTIRPWAAVVGHLPEGSTVRYVEVALWAKMDGVVARARTMRP